VYYELDFDHRAGYFEERLRELVEESVRLHLRADVPLGAYVSGGIDSGVIASLASRHAGGDLVGFTGRYPLGPEFDESRYAHLVARDCGFPLHQLEITGSDFIQNIAEPWISGELAADGVKVTKSQLSWLYTAVAEVACLLGVKIPHIFVRQDPNPNAYTHGTGSQAVVVLTHSLLDQLDGLELRFIIGHEIGHIKSQHVLYSTMASYLLENARTDRDSDVAHFQVELLRWQREAEVTADRAGLLVCGDVRSACFALLTLVVGSRKLAAQMSVEEFVESQQLDLEFNPMAQAMEIRRSHPFMPRRIKELLDYSSSSGYARLTAEGIVLGGSREDEIDIALGASSQNQGSQVRGWHLKIRTN
jgi:Zn-dependent protease with chaperone function